MGRSLVSGPERLKTNPDRLLEMGFDHFCCIRLSCSLLPANTLVMASGNYRFKDFLRVGLSLILISMIITVILLPLLWPAN